MRIQKTHIHNYCIYKNDYTIHFLHEREKENYIREWKCIGIFACTSSYAHFLIRNRFNVRILYNRANVVFLLLFNKNSNIDSNK
jgi:hypothetical protein